MIGAVWLLGTLAYLVARPLGIAFALPFALTATAVLPVIA